MKTEQIMMALASKFRPPEWAFLPQVPDSTGGPASRTADAITMSVWPSRGLELHGIEVKTYRGDWLRELKSPAKAEAICQYCDRWWVAIGEPAIIRDGELPSTWGLLIPRGDEMVIKVKAPKLTPISIDRVFLAAILRRSAEVIVPKDSIAEQLRNEYQRGEKAGRKRNEESIKHAEECEEKLQHTITEFEKASGIHISNWEAGRIGAALKIFMGEPRERLRAELQQAHRRAQQMCDDLARGLSEWPATDLTPPASDRGPASL
jgi:hypothetical protein